MLYRFSFGLLLFGIVTGLYGNEMPQVQNSIEKTSKTVKHQTTNALRGEQSAYLLQHAHNPVNWYPWSDEPFALAKNENKLLFVSIGYSTCHWCHVMEGESFENEEIAGLFNRDYISIKVDKEEMPHIDATYQRYYSLLNSQRNGWPLSFIMTPEKKIVYMGTYIPPNDDYGIKGLKKLLPDLASRYYAKDPQMTASIEAIAKIIKDGKKIETSQKGSSGIVELFLKEATLKYDKIYKGFEKSPKFPLASHLNLLWDIYLQTKSETYKNMVVESLLEISKGGIYDHVEGGFFRYSVYPDWAIPHFEKMLYTQAELIPIYTKVYLHTKNERFKEAILSTLEFANKTLRNGDGLYYSAIDADSKDPSGKKSEGYYYLYAFDEAQKALIKYGIKNSEEVMSYLNIQRGGNFENGLSNPYITELERPKVYDEAINALRTLRQSREFPFVDKKILSSWNTMMIRALAYGSFVDQKYLDDAKKSIVSLEKHLIGNGNLYHQTYENKEPSMDGLLEDYSFYIDALLSLYQVTFDKKYLIGASKFAKIAESKFYADKKWYLDDKKEHEATFGDRYYTAPVSRLFHSLITIANLHYDPKALWRAKEYISEQSGEISAENWLSAEAIRAVYRVQTGDVIVKSSQKNMQKNSILLESIKRAFVLKSLEDSDRYLACDEKSCFADDESIKSIINAIDSRDLSAQKIPKWKIKQ